MSRLVPPVLLFSVALCLGACGAQEGGVCQYRPNPATNGSDCASGLVCCVNRPILGERGTCMLDTACTPVGTDAGRPVDGGPPQDAGHSVDAGSDAGPRDGGRDAGSTPDAGSDAGIDASVDGGGV